MSRHQSHCQVRRALAFHPCLPTCTRNPRRTLAHTSIKNTRGLKRIATNKVFCAPLRRRSQSDGRWCAELSSAGIRRAKKLQVYSCMVKSVQLNRCSHTSTALGYCRSKAAGHNKTGIGANMQISRRKLSESHAIEFSRGFNPNFS